MVHVEQSRDWTIQDKEQWYATHHVTNNQLKGISILYKK